MSYTTKPSMFELMRSGDQITWDRFYHSYRALVILRGQDFGLSGADLDELISRVMLKFFQHHKTFCYDRAKGRFRDYFRSIVSRAALDMLRERKQHTGVELENVSEETLLQDNELEERYEKEWRAHIFNQALQEARNTLPVRAVQAFILNRLRNIPVNEIANLQKVKKSTVYNDCNQVWEFLKSTVKRMSEEY